MQNDIITKLLKIEGFYARDIMLEREEVIIEIERVNDKYLCPKCKQYTMFSNGSEIKEVRHLDILGHKCHLKFHHHRVRCRCRFNGMEELSFVDRYERISKDFEEEFSKYSENMDIKNLCELKRINKNTGYRIDKKKIEERLQKREIEGIEILHADEISVGKGHEYLTILSSPGNPGKVLDVAEDREVNSLSKLLMNLGKRVCSGIKAACVDMWDPYVKSIKTYCENATIVFDKFHILKHLNEAVDKVRRQQWSQSITTMRQFIKGKRWLLLRKKSNLTRKQKIDLEGLLEINREIATVYILKEDFQRFFDYKRKGWAKKFYTRWRDMAILSNLKPLKDFVEMIDAHYDNVFSYFDYRINNGFLEGLNNKIKTIKKIAYGYKDKEYFRLKILQLCGDLPSP